MSTMHELFSPLTLRSLTLDNRIVVAPMCQYSADDGVASDWHLVHVPNLAMSGASLVIVEATGVVPEGRISVGCLGLWGDAHEQALTRVVDVARRTGTAKIGIQLAHAGRKGSCDVAWRGGAQLSVEHGGWQTVAPSTSPFLPADRPPHALREGELHALAAHFADATRRAHRCGFDLVELHAAHGYLLHQFLSPLSNTRTDGYGGSLAARMRFPLEVFDAMRAAWPSDKPLGVRVSAIDWVEGGLSLDDTVAFARALHDRGCDFVHVSSGGLSTAQQVDVKPGFQVPFATRIKREVGVPTIAVGMITDPHVANAIVVDGQADAVALARGMLWNPRWGWHAAQALGHTIRAPRQMLRASSTLVP